MGCGGYVVAVALLEFKFGVLEWMYIQVCGGMDTSLAGGLISGL